MSVKKFRFVSPGVFINEIDNSQLPFQSVGVGPVVIGRSERGPAMTPVQVGSFSEFIEIFGNPIPGGQGGDIWRDGNYTAPTYAAYAAQAWLRNSSPLTFVRLLGTQHIDATTAGQAGWKTTYSAGTDTGVSGDTAATHGGAYGLFVAPAGGGDAALAAVVYVDSGEIGLSGTMAGSTDATVSNKVGTWVKAQGASAEFKLTYSSDGTSTENFVVNFDNSSKKFIRNVLNTNPTLANGDVTPTGSTKDYWLGETYERHLEGFSLVANATSTNTVGVIVNLDGGATFNKDAMTIDAQAAQTPWVFSQHTGDHGDFVVAGTKANVSGVNNLFRFITLSEGGWASKNLKISITDIKAAEDEFNSYGSFTVVVRRAEDSDNTPRYVERFTSCNLNPNSNNYIAKKIGNMYNDWDYTESRYITYGDYPSRSRFIRVKMDSLVDEGRADSQLLPFGFHGIAVPRPVKLAGAKDQTVGTAMANVAAGDATAGTVAVSAAATNGASSANENTSAIHGADVALNFELFFPAMACRKSSSEGNLSNGTQAYFGITTNQSTSVKEDKSYSDTCKPYSEDFYTGEATANEALPQLMSGGAWDGDYFWSGGSMSATAIIKLISTAGETDLKDTTFTLVDSDDVSQVFTFNGDNTTNTSGNIGIDGEDVEAIAQSIVDSINDASVTIGITASPANPVADENGDYIITLTQDSFGLAGNTDVTGVDLADVIDYPTVFAGGSDLASGSDVASAATIADKAGDFYDNGVVPYFSLDDLVMDEIDSGGSYKKSAQHVTWSPGSRYAGVSISVRGNSNANYFNGDGATVYTTSVKSGDYKSVLDHGFDKFTLPLFGGFDGLDIKEQEPFRNTKLGKAGASETTNYAFNSVKRAIDSVADPEVVEFNLATIPGCTNTTLTAHLMNTCEKRADALAIIDLENDYVPSTEAVTSTLPNVQSAVDSLKERGINSSYGCAYFPWVQIRDTISDATFWSPPSVVALGTMSSSENKSELWFAPAGFNRGGLTEGSAGLPVAQVRRKLTSKDRDKLYEANINPIASFPSEGIVIFGQKTLQVTPSALDRINVRRLLIFLKKQISRIASGLLFDNNVPSTWQRFTSQVEPFLASVKTRFGLTEFKVILDETTTTPDLIDRNVMYAKIMLKPARAIEFIAIDFVITRSGASFDD